MTQTGPVTSRSENLQALITRPRYVLFDFDGPICRFFAGHAADRVAVELVDWLDERGMQHLLTDDERRATDPWDVLRAADRRHHGKDVVVELEERLTQEELLAASSASPTAHADLLVRRLVERGVRLAVTTNNSPDAARRYLVDHGLEACFGPHVYGRTHDLSLLKPHPDCLLRALAALDAEPADALMVGDSPSDLVAAQRAGVAFLGYVRNDRKEQQLRDAGAEHLVSSLEDVLRALDG